MKKFGLILVGGLILSIALTGCVSKATNNIGSSQTTNTMVAGTSNNVAGTKQANNDNINTPQQKQTLKVKGELDKSTVTPPKDLFGYLNLTKESMIAKLGKDYEEVNYGNGYYYKNIGLTLFINPYNKVDMIQCDDKVEIYGTRAGMNFNQIKSIYNKSNLMDKLTSEQYDDGYALKYSAGEYSISYESTKEDGSDSNVYIKRNY